MSEAFDLLSEFILKKMRMSHIYQPSMLIELLTNNGEATTEEVAKQLLGRDQSQVDYYKHVTKSMVGKVLTQSRKITSKKDDKYYLNGFGDLSQSEIDRLIVLCEESINNFLSKREDPWSHRRKSTGYISGSIRYKILSRAKFRCELCGISAEHKALEVDHIVPRNLGGSDDETNLQSLCYSCHAMKRDTDDADFRHIKETYNYREPDCLFCNIPEDRVVDENELAYAVYDAFPVTAYHTLVIPKRHVSDYFGLYQPERNALHQLLESCKKKILELDNDISGFNVGNNIGKDGGQTIMHCHTHLIPRRKGDTANPSGGVRGVIPDKQSY